MSQIPNEPFLNLPVSQSALASFRQRWGGDASLLAVAPGRVNVIGEHVDYNGGWVLPVAINRHVAVAARSRDDGIVRLSGPAFGDAGAFSVNALAPDSGDDWGRYAKGVLAGLAEAGFGTTGFDAFLVSNIPVGGGLSSSAAVEAAFALIGLALSGGSMDRIALAKLCQHAEHVYAGVPCGLMDQAAVLNCRKDHLLLLDCEDETFEQAPFDAPDWSLMIIDSRVSHDLASGEYARRRAACHAAAGILGLKNLRGLTEECIEISLQTPGMTPEMQRCVRHVVTENARTRRAVAALAEGRIEEAGRILNESHVSLRDDYTVSCDELDFIAATAQGLPGVAGCRMTGGGFGGSCIALVRKAAVETATQSLSKAYLEKFGRELGVFITEPEEGASVQWLAEEPGV